MKGFIEQVGCYLLINRYPLFHVVTILCDPSKNQHVALTTLSRQSNHKETNISYF
jgi:hypothetical protein